MPAQQQPAAGGKQGGKNFLTRKLGFQPTWAWMAEILGAALAYALYKQRQQASSSSSSTTSSSANGAVPADQVPDVIIQNQLQGPGTTGATTGTSTTGTGTGTPPASTTVPPASSPTPPAVKPSASTTKTMPNVVGQRANFAIGELKSGYNITATTTPKRNSKDEYQVTGQSPAAGTKVASGSKATLNVKVIKT
jgi:hypothetical protein